MRKLFCLVAILMPAAFSASLQDVHSIYILPMGSSLDQYLAQHLVKDGRYEVVTDPQRADAVMTDKVGESFEQKLDEIYPRPPAEDEDDKDKKDMPQPRVGGFSRAHGNVYLVDRTTRVVLWSDYVPPQTGHQDAPDKRARDIVTHLRKHTDKLRKNQLPAAPKPAPATSGIQ